MFTNKEYVDNEAMASLKIIVIESRAMSTDENECYGTHSELYIKL